MRILALIPARGGSKRILGKNIRLLGGRPLISWSIDVVKNNPRICEILVSTDCQDIADICKKEGVLVPWMRPSELATDEASSVDVCLHALDWYESEKGAVDGLLLLQPTSPFRTKEVIKRGIELFKTHSKTPVVGVSPSQSHPMWALKKEGDYLIPFIAGRGLNTRSQDLPPAYSVNGCFYLVSPDDLRKNHSFFSGRVVPLLVESPQEALDIDTEWDWKVAEMIVRNIARCKG